MESRVAAAENASVAVHEAAALIGSRLQSLNVRLAKLHPQRTSANANAARAGGETTRTATTLKTPLPPQLPPQQHDTIFADGQWPDSARFESFVRGLELSGGCTLDVTPANILTYVHGCTNKKIYQQTIALHTRVPPPHPSGH